jgi:Domain of unknown function (DUF6883)
VRLPNAERAIIDPRKIRDYLLSEGHPVGRFKARFFARLGFATERWQDLRAQLEAMALQEEAEVVERTEYGQKYVVRGTIVGVAGQPAKVLTVWIVLHDERVPRFVTAYPEF